MNNEQKLQEVLENQVAPEYGDVEQVGEVTDTGLLLSDVSPQLMIQTVKGDGTFPVYVTPDGLIVIDTGAQCGQDVDPADLAKLRDLILSKRQISVIVTPSVSDTELDERLTALELTSELSPAEMFRREFIIRMEQDHQLTEEDDAANWREYNRMLAEEQGY